MTVGENILNAFDADLTRAVEQHADLIDQLASQVGSASASVQDDFHWDVVDDLKGYLGALSANASPDNEEDQDELVSCAETWVSKNVSQSDASRLVAVLIVLNGAKETQRRVSSLSSSDESPAL